MTQTFIKGLVALGAAALIAVAGFALFMPAPQSLGGSMYEALPKWYGNGLQVGTGQQFAVDGSGNVAFANSAGTSTLSGLGCMQMFATSSATAVKLVLSAAGATSTFKGTAYWTYGTCP
jgi:hypothetical protein